MAQTERSLEQRPVRAITVQQVVELTGYDVAQIALIRNSVAKDAPLEELAVFLHGARQLGLDPLAKQVYWIRRKGKGTLQVGIDGFRLVAARTNAYAGSEQPTFRGSVDVQVGRRTITAPALAIVTVWKIVGGHKCAFTGEARWAEFYPGDDADGFMYRKMPYHMLAKDAEAQALRKAFPAEMTAMPATAGDQTIQGPDEVIVEERTRPPRRALTAADYDRIYGSDAEGNQFADMPKNGPRTAASASAEPDVPQDVQEREATRSELVASYRTLLADAQRQLGDAFIAADWALPVDASDDEIEQKGVALSELLTGTPSVHEEGLKRNAALLLDAEAAGVKGLRMLKASRSERLEVILRKNSELSALLLLMFEQAKS